MSVELVAQRILWVVPAFLQGAMAIVMVRRKFHRELPLFFVFLLFKVLLNCFLWLFRHQMPHYFYCYWIGEAIGLVLGLAIVYEIFWSVLRRYETIQRTGSLIYRWAAVALLVVATITAAMGPDMDSVQIIEGILVLERGVRIVQAGLLLILFLFASYLGLSWRSSVFGIALGFGIYASAELALVAIRAEMGANADHLYVWVKMIALSFTAVIWTVYLLQPQVKPEVITAVPKTEVGVWDQALMEYLRR